MMLQPVGARKPNSPRWDLPNQQIRRSFPLRLGLIDPILAKFGHAGSGPRLKCVNIDRKTSAAGDAEGRAARQRQRDDPRSRIDL